MNHNKDIAKKRRHARYAEQFADEEQGGYNSPMGGVTETLRLFGLEPSRKRDKFNTWSARSPKWGTGGKGQFDYSDNSGYTSPLKHTLPLEKPIKCVGPKQIVGSLRTVKNNVRSEKERRLTDLRRTPAERRKLRVY